MPIFKAAENKRGGGKGGFKTSPKPTLDYITRPDKAATVTAWFHRFIIKNDLPYISIHGLRHTNASLLISSGVPITTTAKRLGHTTSATTSKIYAHAINSADAMAATAIESILPRRRKNA